MKNTKMYAGYWLPEELALVTKRLEIGAKYLAPNIVIRSGNRGQLGDTWYRDVATKKLP